MAVLIAVIVTFGFSQTIEGGLIHPSFSIPAILYIHVAVFIGWIFLLIIQTGLIQTNRTNLHRKFGLTSLCLGVALPVVGIWVSIVMARIGAQQSGPQAAIFLIVPFADMLNFSTLFGMAIWNRKNVEAHRRLMLMATWSLTGAAFGRFPSFIVPYGGWYYLAVDMMIFLGVARDFFVLRKVHRVYLIGLPLLMVSQSITLLIFYSDWWAHWSQRFI